MKVAGRSDIGRVRAVNEDRSYVQADVNGAGLAIVADGMGGHQAGDTASQLAIDTIAAKLQAMTADMPPEAIEEAVAEAIAEANGTVYAIAEGSDQFHGMGTTVVVGAAAGGYLIVGHIGDSRAYLVRGGAIRQLTADHSLVHELLRSGQITEDEAARHPRRHVLTRALGTEPTVISEVNRFDWQPGDIVLICSDGLSGLVDSGDMFSVLSAEGDLDAKVDGLIGLALEAGGDDNVTVALLEYETEPKAGDHR